LFNYGYYIIRNDDIKLLKIIKNLEKTTSSTITVYEFGKLKPTGFFIGWKYCGFYQDISSEREQKKELHLYTSIHIFNKLVNDDDTNSDDIIINISNDYKPEKNVNKKEIIIIFDRVGAYHRLYYDKRNFDISKYIPLISQNIIMESIKQIYYHKKNASIFISGPPGSGKSMIGFLLAKELNSKIVRTFNPTEPGDTMIQLIRDTEPDEQSPLIIMLDEADIMIRKITEHLIQPHKNIPIMVYDKISFNRFMDDMMFYHNVILIMTSNEPKENIDAIDNSFLRKGRIDESFTL
jgi:Cdc6-like AAA superfamily ATPase